MSEETISDLEERIEQRKREMIEQQTGFDLDGTLDDPELFALQAELDRVRKRKQ